MILFLIGCFIGAAVMYGIDTLKLYDVCHYPHKMLDEYDDVGVYAKDVIWYVKNRLRFAGRATDNWERYQQLLVTTEVMHTLDTPNDDVHFGRDWFCSFLRLLHICGLVMHIEQAEIEDEAPTRIPGGSLRKVVRRPDPYEGL